MGASLGAGALWVNTSQRRAARWARQMIADARRGIAPAPVKPKPEQWPDNDITICWLGHATALIDFYGIRVLTDPALGNRIGISLGLGTAGPKRYVAPALPLRDLPPIDVILLSHAHMDHMDLPSLRRFPSSTFTVTAKDTSDILGSARLERVVELPWNERTTFRSRKGELEIQAFEVKHWGQRLRVAARRQGDPLRRRYGADAAVFGPARAWSV